MTATYVGVARRLSDIVRGAVESFSDINGELTIMGHLHLLASWLQNIGCDRIVQLDPCDADEFVRVIDPLIDRLLDGLHSIDEARTTCTDTKIAELELSGLPAFGRIMNTVNSFEQRRFMRLSGYGLGQARP